MLRTLHTYVGRDLLRVTCLAVVAFTLVMTVFAIIEPLRKSGLAASQVGMLFGYTLPVMVSLTLPFAALFASTIVYGRFSQDLELLACRASGISTITILKPAIALGIGVSIITLILANFISPRMARQAEATAMQNIKKIAYHLIQKESHVKFDKGENIIIVHASRVDEENDSLLGVVAGRFTWRKDPLTGKNAPVVDVLVASSAALNVNRDEGGDKYYASVEMENPVGPITNKAGMQGELKRGSLLNFELDSPTKDKPAFFDWDALISMYKDPTQHSEVKAEMEKIHKAVRQNRIVQDIADTINAGKIYGKIHSETETEVYELSAPQAVISGDEALLVSGKNKAGQLQRVVLRIRSENGNEMVYAADRGKIIADWDQIRRKESVMIEIAGNLQLPRQMTDSHSEAPRKPSWNSGRLPLPQDEEYAKVAMVELLEKPEQFTNSEPILRKIKALQKDRPAKIRGEIEAEMNFRIAYGLSCALLVTMGAALGVIFKGGQFLTAFAISVIPAAIIIILILMGKRLISNPDSSTTGGYIAIWGGFLALLGANVIVYFRLSRR